MGGALGTEQWDEAKGCRGMGVTGHRSRVTGHGSQVTGHRSRVTGHRSRVTGHGSRVTGHGSLFIVYSLIVIDKHLFPTRIEGPCIFDQVAVFIVLENDLADHLVIANDLGGMSGFV